jgi:hypothetical protein
MIDSTQNAVILLNVENNVVPGLKDVDFNFMDPNVNVKSYLDLFDSEEVDLSLSDSKMTLKQNNQNADLYFCVEDFVSVFGGDDSGIKTDYFYQTTIDDTMTSMLNKVRKIGGKFGKVYFSVEKGRFYMEAVDKSNRFSNGLKFELDRLKVDDLETYYDFKYFNAILMVISDNITDFTMKFAYKEDQEAGMILFENSTGSEKYYLMSKIDG